MALQPGIAKSLSLHLRFPRTNISAPELEYVGILDRMRDSGMEVHLPESQMAPTSPFV